MKKIIYCFLNLSLLFFNSCSAQTEQQKETSSTETKQPIKTGAEQVEKYLPILENKNVILMVNQTSTIENTHLVDSLRSLNIEIKAIFAPEHGFRGTADAGEKIENGVDSKTGIPIISLYGKHKKPTQEDLVEVDMVVFDIQDVGARFYTYISSLHYVMEACAENKVEVLVLDRPNPNGHFVDGYVRDEQYKSFVGMHPIPVVHGMTIAEYAQMINGEFWLEDSMQSQLSVVKCENYDHKTRYELPIKPSPNLPNAQAIALYPSICFFEGTVISVGRGTAFPFQVIGNPDVPKENTTFQFTPVSTSGAKYPKHENKVCNGFDLRESETADRLNIEWLIALYNLYPNKKEFFLENGFFELLAGTDRLRNALINNKTSEDIAAEWADEVAEFKEVRKKYLLYDDFE